MKNIVFSLILSMQAFCGYENQIENIWDQASEKLKVNTPSGFLPKNIQIVLEENEQERLLLLFYPKKSSFWRLSEDPSYYPGITETKELAVSLGYTIVRLEPIAHMAHFDSLEDLNAFIEKHFDTQLVTDDLPMDDEGKISFPSRLILLELKKS